MHSFRLQEETYSALEKHSTLRAGDGSPGRLESLIMVMKRAAGAAIRFTICISYTDICLLILKMVLS